MASNTVIQALESNPGYLRENWCIPHNAGRFLYVMALSVQAKSICEVGTSIGYSTLWLAQAAAQTGGKVTTIEYSEERQKQATANIEKAGYAEQVCFLTGQALDVLDECREAGETFDFAFVDAAKKQYLGYVQKLEPMMFSGGILIADNTQSHREEMQDFIDYVEASHQFDVTELETTNGLYVLRKR